MADAASRVAIVTVTYNSESVLHAFLDSIPDGSVAQVVVVDNTNGADAGVAAIASQFPLVQLVPSVNHGYGGGMNRGIAALSADIEWVIISNPDVTLTPGTIDGLLAAAKAHPRGGAFGPVIRTAEGDVYPSARRLPSLRTGIGHALFSRIWPSNPWSARYREGIESYASERESGWLSGSFMLLRQDALREIGGFDDSYFMYFEDVDLGDRLSKAGWSLHLIPSAEITHTGAHSTTQSSRAMMVAHHASAYQYLARKYRAWYLWPLRVALRIALKTRAWVTSR